MSISLRASSVPDPTCTGSNRTRRHWTGSVVSETGEAYFRENEEENVKASFDSH